MCMTSAKAKLSDTFLYAGRADYNGKNVHVLAYQNKATNLSNQPNAMILPFPTHQEMGPENIIDTRPFPYFLADIAKASRQATRGMKTLGRSSIQNSLPKVFESGSYTVVLAGGGGIDAIPAALEQVPENKRPSISPEFLDSFSKLYPNQPIAICCWSGEIKAEPLLWWYEPKDEDNLFLPAMDAHDGSAPNLNNLVEVDHLVSVGSTSSRANKVNYRDAIPDAVRDLLPSDVFGVKVEGRFLNGDFSCSVFEAYDKSFRPGVPKISRGFQGKFSNEFPMYGWV